MKRFILPLVCLLVAGCSEPKIPDEARIESLRVLALVADQPEADPGTTLRITPYLADPVGQGRALTYSAWACVPKSSTYGEDVTCDGGKYAQVLVQDEPVTGLPESDGIGPAVAFDLTLPSETELGGSPATLPESYSLEYVIVYELKAKGGETRRAYKVVTVSKRAAKNRNPVPIRVLSDGQPFETLASGSHSLSVEFDASSAETYEADGTRTEDLATAWYATAGELGSLASQGLLGTVTYSGPGTGTGVVLVAVAIDRRGGAAVVIQRF